VGGSWAWQTSRTGPEVHNGGHFGWSFGQHDTAATTEHLTLVDPDLVVVCLGAGTASAATATWRAALNSLIDRVQAACTASILYVFEQRITSISDAVWSAKRDAAREVCVEQGVTLFDGYNLLGNVGSGSCVYDGGDQIHLNASGQAALGAAISAPLVGLDKRPQNLPAGSVWIDAAALTNLTADDLAAVLAEIDTALTAKADAADYLALTGGTLSGFVFFRTTGQNGEAAVGALTALGGGAVIVRSSAAHANFQGALTPGQLGLGRTAVDAAPTWVLSVNSDNVATLTAGDRIESADAPANDSTLTRFGAVVPRAEVLTESGTTRTLALTDLWDYIRATSGSTLALTVPANTTVAVPVKSEVYIRPVAGTVVTVTAAGGVTVNPPAGGTLVLAGDAALKKVATDEWDLIGSTVAA
jgi:hypothetical protein